MLPKAIRSYPRQYPVRFGLRLVRAFDTLIHEREDPTFLSQACVILGWAAGIGSGLVFNPLLGRGG